MTQFCGLLLALALGSADSQGLQEARPGRSNLFAATPDGPEVTEVLGMLQRRLQAGAKSMGALAFGEASTVSGDYSVTLGYGCTAGPVHNNTDGRRRLQTTSYNTAASGSYSSAMGYRTTASGSSSTAMGYATTASGSESTATGYKTTASGSTSIAMCASTTASGSSSTAMGYKTTASGSDSTAMGSMTTASGGKSTAMGYKTKAESMAETVVGQYNALGTSADTWWATTDAAFRVGIGTSENDREDALTVYKDGTVAISGDLRVSGSISSNQGRRLAALEASAAKQQQAMEQKVAALEAAVAALTLRLGGE